jgi:hypothetical protein
MTMTPQGKFDYLAGMVALIQNHDDRLGTTDRMAFFLKDNCPNFNEQRFRDCVGLFHEAFAAERERSRARREVGAAAQERANARAAALRRRLVTLFNGISNNPRQIHKGRHDGHAI